MVDEGCGGRGAQRAAGRGAVGDRRRRRRRAQAGRAAGGARLHRAGTARRRRRASPTCTSSPTRTRTRRRSPPPRRSSTAAEEAAGRGRRGARRPRPPSCAELEARAMQVQAEIDELKRRSPSSTTTADEVDDELAEAEEARDEAQAGASTEATQEPRRRSPELEAGARLGSGVEVRGYPSAQPFERSTASFQRRVRRVRRPTRSAAGAKGVSSCQVSREVVGRRPDAGAEAGEERRAEAPWSRRASAARPVRRAGRPGAGRAGRWPTRRRRRAERRRARASSRARRAPRTRSPPGWPGRCGRGSCRG